MDEFRLNPISLFLILLLHLTAGTRQDAPNFYARGGGEVTLPCGSGNTDQDKCDNTDWIFNSDSQDEVEQLVTRGKIAENEFAKANAARLGVTASCSLVIKKVRYKDVGQYICTQRTSRGQGRSAMFLSLVTLTERERGNKTELECSVSIRGQCRDSVMWQYEDEELESFPHPIKMSAVPCRIAVEFETSKYKKERFKCEVSDGKEEVETFYYTLEVQDAPNVYARDGSEVTLPCESMNIDQVECNHTDWIFNRYSLGMAEQLVTRGKIAENEFAQANAARLRVTASCSLVINKFTFKDIGQYVCKQRTSDGHRRSAVSLSRVMMTEREKGNKTELQCSVSSHVLCRKTVMWRYGDEEISSLPGDVMLWGVPCRVSVAFDTSMLDKERFKCQVSDRGRDVQTFDYSLLASVTESPAVASPLKPAASSGLNYAMLALRAAELFLITVITALLIKMWCKARGSQTSRGDNAVRNVDDDYDSVRYESTDGPSASVRFHR